MLVCDAIVPGAAALDEAKAYLRIAGSGEDALLAGLLVAALERCESYTGTLLIERGVRETVDRTAGWTALTARPATAITAVAALAADGSGSALPVSAHELDIDSTGIGRVRFAGPERGRVLVEYRAGAWSGWTAIPATLRAGAVLLAAHWHRSRDEDAAPPRAAFDQWRPARRVGL